MFGRKCRECKKPVKKDYCNDKVSIFKRSCEKHLKEFDKQKQQHRKKGLFGEIFDEMHNVYAKAVRPR